ncbi:unnamed protein product [Bursaphelenchus okinawaensis]|uniref:Uncharacterized protein n=1 Tax=Bursaphelenchus okinawaensis TaxID=465554 RepID=A0A811L8E5_9BILA|nr:unnamed protein product [Bursaphelenchus okinawaensis]CAG9121049.1 unnamed protein product [Bursaphelenchus okinawaensis]
MNVSTIFRTCLLALLSIECSVQSLACYDNEAGVVTTVESPDIKFCVVIPERVNDNGKIETASIFGIKKENIASTEQDKLTAMLSESNNGHSVVAVCMHEKYDMYKMVINSGVVNPKIAAQTLLAQEGASYIVRCVCNTDLCNKGSSIDEFYRSQRSV